MSSSVMPRRKKVARFGSLPQRRPFFDRLSLQCRRLERKMHEAALGMSTTETGNRARREWVGDGCLPPGKENAADSQDVNGRSMKERS
jgi:hypothetical protein